jgi:hypothetical protein
VWLGGLNSHTPDLSGPSGQQSPGRLGFNLKFFQQPLWSCMFVFASLRGERLFPWLNEVCLLAEEGIPSILLFVKHGAAKFKMANPLPCPKRHKLFQFYNGQSYQLASN